MSKKLTGSIAVLLALALSLAACSKKEETPSPAAVSSAAAEQPSEGGTATFTATEPISYSFDYPDLWTIEESGDSSSPIQLNGDKVAIGLDIQEVGDTTLDEYVVSAQQTLASIKGITVEGQTDSTMGSEPAVTITSTQAKGGKSIILSQTIAVVGGQAFVVTYGGTGDRFDADMPTAQAVIDSFRF